jgi:hypothetical protein
MLALSALGRVESSTIELINFERDAGEAMQRIQTIVVESTRQDNFNDRHIGALDDVMRAAISLAEDPAEREVLEQTYQVVFSSSRASLVLGAYAGMAGEAARIEAALRDRHRDALSKIILFGTTALDLLNRWLAGCRRLTTLDQERRELQSAQDGTRRTAGDLQALRNQWIRAMSLFIAAVESSDQITSQEADLILSPIRVAQRRAATSNARPAPTPAPTPEAEPAD